MLKGIIWLIVFMVDGLWLVARILFAFGLKLKWPTLQV